MNVKILESIKKEYDAKAEQATVNLSIALSNTISIPDHFNYCEDLKKQIEEIDKYANLSDTVSAFIERLEEEEDDE